MATIGANFLVKSVDLDDIKVGLQIWDLGGHTRSGQVGRVFFQGVSGALLVYDLTRPDTLEKIPLWQDQLKKFSPEAKLYLVGNKNDLVNERKISTEEGRKAQKNFATNHFFETSAKTGDYIQEAFEHMASSLVEASKEASK